MPKIVPLEERNVGLAMAPLPQLVMVLPVAGVLPPISLPTSILASDDEPTNEIPTFTLLIVLP